MNLKNIADEKLLLQTDELVNAERKLLIDLLHHLREIEEKIAGGELSLTNIGMARTLFRKEKRAGREMNRDAKLIYLRR